MDRGFVVWLTGLSGAGKSTLAELLARELRWRGREVEILDGDEVRRHLSQGLGFSREDRDINVQRIATYQTAGSATAWSSSWRRLPYRRPGTGPAGDRDFVEVYVKCPLAVRQDVKGLYKKALAGKSRRSPACPTVRGAWSRTWWWTRL